MARKTSPEGEQALAAPAPGEVPSKAGSVEAPPSAPLAPPPKIVTIVRGERVRECAEADLPYFEYRGFKKRE